jgi:hypothetical protein
MSLISLLPEINFLRLKIGKFERVGHDLPGLFETAQFAFGDSLDEDIADRRCFYGTSLDRNSESRSGELVQ